MKKQYLFSRTLAIVRKHYPSAVKVRDATADLVVDVLPSDAKSGRRKNHDKCALAVACKRGGSVATIVSRSRVYLIDKAGVATRYCVPESVSREIVSFDRGAGFDATRVVLLKPTPMQRIGHGYPRGYGANMSKRRPAIVTRNVRTTLK